MLPPITGDEDLDSFLRFVQDSLLSAETSTGPVADTATGVVLDPTTNQTIGYLYKYLHVKYADDALGTGISDTPVGKTHYGIRNSNESMEPTNPAEYSWKEVIGGFGPSKRLWYLLGGGRNIVFVASTSNPAPGYVLEDNSTIDLDNVLTDGVIVGSFLADDSVSTNKLADGAVTNPKLADDSVSTSKLADDAVTNSKLADDSVGTTKLADGAVTEAKIQDDSVGASKLKAGIVTVTKDTVNADIYDGVAVATVLGVYPIAGAWGTGNYFRSFSGYLEVTHTHTAPLFLAVEAWQSRGVQAGQTVADERYVLFGSGPRKIGIVLHDLFIGDSTLGDTDTNIGVSAFFADGTPANNITKVSLIGTVTTKEENFQ